MGFIWYEYFKKGCILKDEKVGQRSYTDFLEVLVSTFVGISVIVITNGYLSLYIIFLKPFSYQASALRYVGSVYHFK